MPSRPPRRLLFGGVALLLTLLFALAVPAQVIEYENNGRKYQTLTHKGLTVIVTRLPNRVAGFGVLQVSISNGSDIYWIVQPEGFAYVIGDQASNGISAEQFVDVLLSKGSSSDVTKLVNSYEANLYGIPNMRTTNGYEQRRQGAFAFGVNSKLKAAATASALALTKVRLAPGQSTDGSVFIPMSHDMKALGSGRVVFRSANETFEFNPD